MPPLQSYTDNFKAFQDLTKQIAETLHILLEEIQEAQHGLLKILHTSLQGKIILPVKDAVLAPLLYGMANFSHYTTYV